MVRRIYKPKGRAIPGGEFSSIAEQGRYHHAMKAMKRGSLFIFTVFSLFSGTLLVAGKPNVVLVITDDQGYGDLGAHGHPLVQTPHLDALHAESVRLEDYHVAPTCAPSRSALYTGHWTNRTGVWHTIQGRSMLRVNEITMGDVFADAGYATGFFGKWHLGDNYPYRPEERGFHEVVRHGGGGIGQTPDFWNNAYFDDTYWHNGVAEKYHGHCTDIWFRTAREFIAARTAAGQPFFAVISTNAPHSPMHAPQEFADLYKESLPDHPNDPLKKHARKNRVADRHYFGMISHIDSNVGSLREFLAASGVAENTIFIFTTDNGTVAPRIFDGGMRGCKGSAYEGGHRVPFFVHYPAGEIVGGRAVKTLTAHVDILPTLIELCDVPAPEGVVFDGASISSLLRLGDAGWSQPDRVLITDSQRVKDPIMWRNSSTMSGSYRLINGEELYDVSADPKQNKNIIDEQPEVAQRLRSAYQAWWEELEPTFSQTTEIYLGHAQANPVRLTSHDWISTGNSPWNQGQIRAAQDNPDSFGPWAVKVIEAGDYQIEFRRWPEEADHPIRADLVGAPGVPGEVSKRTRVGVGVPAKECVLTIGGKKYRKPVAEGDKAILFEVSLEEGPAELFGQFIREDGSAIGAYFACVEKL